MDCFLDCEGCFYIPFFILTYIFIILITIDSIEFQRIGKIILKKSSKIFFLEL